ncbi:MAG: hypothetical protein IPM81_09830 [Saprospirales bacterium]|nr:hypothetical protein [Saprospirales bacterium]
MEYFIMSKSTDPKVIGPKYPQCEKMCGEERGEYYYPAPWSVWNIPSEGELKVLPKVDCFELKYHAKVTDLISAIQLSASSVMLISERFYNLLMNFNCMRSVVFESKVMHRQKSHPFRFLYFPEYHEHFIDFKKSRFYLGNATGSWYYNINIERFEEYKKEQGKREQQNDIARKKVGEKMEFITLLELYLDESKIDMDLFRLLGPMLAFIVSQRLKDAIESQGLTGMKFTPAQGFKRHVMDFSVTPPRKIE